jgi:DNA polymerase-1
LKIATFDCEANGLLDEADTIWCVIIKDHSDGQIYSYGPDRIPDAIVHLSSFDALIGHNSIAYDFPLLRKLYGWEYAGEKIDTLLMSRMQRPERKLPPMCKNRLAGPHSVEAWAYRIGEDRKLEHEDWSQYSEAMLARCVRDCELQYKIYLALLEEGAGEGWERAHKLNHKLFHYLEKQESYGWLVDRKWFEFCIRVLDRYIAAIDRKVVPQLPLVTEIGETKKDGEWGYVKKPFLKSGLLNERVVDLLGERAIYVCGPFSRIAFRPVDLNSNQETKEFLLAQGWEPAEWNTNNEGKRTSPKLSKTDPFEGIDGELGRMVARRVQARHRKSQIEGWLAAIRPDGRIAAEVGGVATTGRLTHRVIVNVPSPTTKSFFAKQMRKGFIAQPGWKLIGVDSKSNQIRQLAARIDDPAFTEFVLSGLDIHERNRQLSGVPTRTIAKNLYYGTIFGAGDAKIGKLVGGGKAEGKALKAQFFTALPTFPAWIEGEIAKWRQTASKWWNKRYGKWQYESGYITGLDGRPILVKVEKDILAFYLQSDESIQMASAYCWANKQLEKKGYKWGEDYGFCIWMHDEFQVEAREEIAEDVARICSDAIAWAGKWLKIKCPHEGDIKIGRNWFETH